MNTGPTVGRRDPAHSRHRLTHRLKFVRAMLLLTSTIGPNASWRGSFSVQIVAAASPKASLKSRPVLSCTISAGVGTFALSLSWTRLANRPATAFFESLGRSSNGRKSPRSDPCAPRTEFPVDCQKLGRTRSGGSLVLPVSTPTRPRLAVLTTRPTPPATTTLHCADTHQWRLRLCGRHPWPESLSRRR